jgi:hypothetical protein
VTHLVRMQDFENWLNRGRRSPAETVLKGGCGKYLGCAKNNIRRTGWISMVAAASRGERCPLTVRPAMRLLIALYRIYTIVLHVYYPFVSRRHSKEEF